MSLSSVLVDCARVLRYEALRKQLPDGTVVLDRVEGTTQYEWVPGPYFDCRIDSPAAPDVSDAAGGRTRSSSHPTLIFETEDCCGNLVELHADDRIEVVSQELGTATFRLTGEPVLYRKKQDLIAGEAALERILDFGTTQGRIAAVQDGATAGVTITTGGTGSVH